MTMNAAYRCTHGTVRRLVTKGTLGTVGKLLCVVSIYVVANTMISQNCPQW